METQATYVVAQPAADTRQRWLQERRKRPWFGANQTGGLGLSERFWQKTEWQGECLIWHGAVNKNGYGSFSINGRSETASRVAWMLTHDSPIPDGMLVCHRCDNPLCMNAEHLFLGTHQDNMLDRDMKGRARGVCITSRGSGNVKAKLTEAQVLEIATSQERTCVLMRRYCVNKTTIQRIRSKTQWKHLWTQGSNG